MNLRNFITHSSDYGGMREKMKRRFLYLLANKKSNKSLKGLWKSWNIVQKIVLLLMIITNIYILGEVDLFSKFVYFTLYIGMNILAYIILSLSGTASKI